MNEPPNLPFHITVSIQMEQSMAWMKLKAPSALSSQNSRRMSISGDELIPSMVKRWNSLLLRLILSVLSSTYTINRVSAQLLYAEWLYSPSNYCWWNLEICETDWSGHCWILQRRIYDNFQAVKLNYFLIILQEKSNELSF